MGKICAEMHKAVLRVGGLENEREREKGRRAKQLESLLTRLRVAWEIRHAA